MRELREFREAHPEFERADVAVAGVSGDPPASHRAMIERLHLPFPLLSDPDRSAGRALGLIRQFGVGAWKVELFRRATLLVDEHGIVAAAWGDVRVRGHARAVLAAAEVLQAARDAEADRPPRTPRAGP